MSTNILIDHWPILSTIVGGILAFGSIKSDVAALKTEQELSRSDHDILIELRTHDKEQNDALAEVRENIKELLRQNERNRH